MGGGRLVGFWIVGAVLAVIFGEPGTRTLVTDLKAEGSLAVLIG